MRQAQFGMRQRVGQICKEGPAGILTDEVEGLSVYYVLRICLAPGVDVLGVVYAEVVIPQVVGVV